MYLVKLVAMDEGKYAFSLLVRYLPKRTFDSTTINLCFNLFLWTNVHKTIKNHDNTLFDQTIHLSRQLTKTHHGYSREYDQNSNFFSKNIFCLIAIIGHEIPHSRSFLNLLRFFSLPLLDRTPIRDFFKRIEKVDVTSENSLRQIRRNFDYQ